MSLIRRRGGIPTGNDGPGAGQSLVEFAFVFPIFLLLILGLIEFTFVFSGMLGISYATRDAALVAAEAGWYPGADCVIIKAVDQAVSAPADDNRITVITIYRADLNGVEAAGVSNQWHRNLPTEAPSPCPDGTTVPYTQQTFGYPEGTNPINSVPFRCNWVNGCDDDGDGVSDRPLDTIGVRVEYVHRWVTPLGGFPGPGFGGQGGNGFTLTQSNSMRMEPVL